MKFNSVVEAVAYHAKHTPEKICLIDKEKKYTYSKLWNCLKNFNIYLKKSGLNDGDRVIIKNSQSIDTVVAMLGVQLAGGVSVPVEKGIAETRIIELLEYTEASMFISSQPVNYPCLYIAIDIVCDCGEHTEDDDIVFPDSDNICDIIFTTGTTGKSKGVMLSFKSQIASAETISRFAEITPDDVVMVPFPLNHGGGLRRTYAILFVGGTEVLQNGVIFIKNFFCAIDEFGVTVIYLAPAYLSIILSSAAEQLRAYDGRLKLVNISAAATPEIHKRQLRELLPNVRLFLSYSSTETGGVSFLEFSKYPDKQHCIGEPGKILDLTFIDDNNTPIANTSCENPGIIVCKSERIMSGYWKDPEYTKKTLIDGYIRTSDMGYLDEDGFFCLIGRKDDVIITGANKVAPDEIEELVMMIPGINDCACIAVPDPIMGAVPKLFVVMENDVDFSQREISEFLSGKLEYFKVPRYIEQIDSIPRSGELGKIKRKKLTELATLEG